MRTPTKPTAGSAASATTPQAAKPADFGQIVLVFQGGGALGAYQAGVYEALHDAGIEPDWVIGTSIGAINAAIIAGNQPADRMDRLRDFWSLVRQNPMAQALGNLPVFGPMFANLVTMTNGLPNFFTPNLSAFGGNHVSLGAEAAGYYSTQALSKTLSGLIDFDCMSNGPVRLTVGAANVRTGDMRYFDSRDEALDLRHVMASGALPPAFPAVRIDGDLYWDGGILSNTPVEVVFDDFPRRNSLVFAVHIWNPSGPEPVSINQVLNRQKDIQYASRAVSHIARQRQIHRLRHVVAELAALIPEAMRDTEAAKILRAHGCLTRMHVVRLLAPGIPGETHSKDIDFSPAGVQSRWESGRADTIRMLAASPWLGEHDPLDGFILHEVGYGGGAQ